MKWTDDQETTTFQSSSDEFYEARVTELEDGWNWATQELEGDYRSAEGWEWTESTAKDAVRHTLKRWGILTDVVVEKDVRIAELEKENTELRPLAEWHAARTNPPDPNATPSTLTIVPAKKKDEK